MKAEIYHNGQLIRVIENAKYLLKDVITGSSVHVFDESNKLIAYVPDTCLVIITESK